MTGANGFTRMISSQISLNFASHNIGQRTPPCARNALCIWCAQLIAFRKITLDGFQRGVGGGAIFLPSEGTDWHWRNEHHLGAAGAPKEKARFIKMLIKPALFSINHGNDQLGLQILLDLRRLT